jgi:iron complex transport system ATP-binding protein
VPLPTKQVSFIPVSQILNLEDVRVIRDGKTILGPLSLAISEAQRWVIVGPNGAGKTTLFQLAATNIHPTSGTIDVLESRIGRTDVFELRPRIGLMTTNLVTSIPEDELVIDLVMSSAYAIVGRWNENYDLWDESRAMSLITTMGVRDLKDRIFGTLSEGEKKRVLIARALMPNPELLLLDEPAAGLDLAGREDLLKRLDTLAADPLSPATLIVTHHLEEIPHGTTHALLLSGGLAISSGEIETVLTSENLSLAYGIGISVINEGGRYFARAL